MIPASFPWPEPMMQHRGEREKRQGGSGQSFRHPPHSLALIPQPRRIGWSCSSPGPALSGSVSQSRPSGSFRTWGHGPSVQDLWPGAQHEGFRKIIQRLLSVQPLLHRNPCRVWWRHTSHLCGEHADLWKVEISGWSWGRARGAERGRDLCPVLFHFHTSHPKGHL